MNGILDELGIPGERMAVRDKSNRFTAIGRVNGRVRAGGRVMSACCSLKFRFDLQSCSFPTLKFRRPERNPDYNLHTSRFIVGDSMPLSGISQHPLSFN